MGKYVRRLGDGTVSALFTAANWRPIATRTDRLRDCDLLVRVLLIRHRREPNRAALITEVLRHDGGGDELVNLGGSALELNGVAPQRCRELFQQAVERLLPIEGER